MSTFGKTSVGASAPATLSSNFLRGTKYTLLEDGHVTKFTVMLDGLGTSNASPALWRVVAYAADGAGGYPNTFKALSSEVSIPFGQAASLVDFALPGGVDLTAGDYYLFIFTGGASSVARGYREAGGVGYAPSTTYPNAPSPFPTGAGSSAFTYYMYATYTPATGNLPSNDVPPAVTGNTGYGSTLTVSNGTWSGTGPFTYTYQWQRNGVNISTATTATYLTTLFDLGKTIICVVTATSATGATPATSNGIVVTAPTVEALGKLKYALPVQSSPITIDLTAAPGPYFVTTSTNAWTANKDYIIKLSPTVPRTGRLEIDANGARSLVIIGGLWALDDNVGGAQNYHIHVQNLKGWAFIEGQEADMSKTNADFASISGSSLYTPDIYRQNWRILNLTANNNTNHADIFQPQGKISHDYADKITFSSNYDGYTIAADGSLGNQPAAGFKFSRHNAWYSDVNAVNPVTAFFWIMNANGATAPSPINMQDVYIDLDRGVGRNYSITKAAFFPNEGMTASGSPYFPDGALIGASDDGSFSSFTNPAMLVTGGVHKGSPNASRADVSAAGDFVPPGIGYSYVSPGYESGGTKVRVSGSWVDTVPQARVGGVWVDGTTKKRNAGGWS